jgi:phosphatidylglycerol:prolipoprotein diacylglycerol transferase
MGSLCPALVWHVNADGHPRRRHRSQPLCEPPGRRPRQPLGHAVLDFNSWFYRGPALLRIYSIPRGPDGLGYYLAHPITILQIWTGGIHIFGGFIFGIIALLVFTRIRRLQPLPYLDGIALGLPLAQAIGRWGNFINQELYGPPTHLPWGLRIDPEHRLAPYDNLGQYPDSIRFQPLFLYESAWNLVGFGVLLWVVRRFEPQLKPGDLSLIYLIWYPLGRFFLEFFRTDSWFFSGTPFNLVHILAVLALAIASLLLYRRHSAST